MPRSRKPRNAPNLRLVPGRTAPPAPEPFDPGNWDPDEFETNEHLATGELLRDRLRAFIILGYFNNLTDRELDALFTAYDFCTNDIDISEELTEAHVARFPDYWAKTGFAE